MFALKRTSLGSVLDCVAPCLEESLLSLAKLRLEEVWKSFTEHTKCVDVWLKNDSELHGPPSNTQPRLARWSTHFCKEKDSLARGHRSGTSSSLWSLLYSDPIRSS